MTPILGQLYTVPGVRGAALFDESGGCVEHRNLPNDVSVEHMGRILDKLLVGLEAYTYVERGAFRYAFAQYGDSVFAVLRTAGHRAIVLASSDINRSLLAVAFGALEVKLDELNGGALDSSVSRRRIAAPAAQGSAGPGLPVKDAVAKPVLDDLHAALADAIGPIARLLIQEHCAKLRLSAAAVPKGQWTTLTDSLAQEIPDEPGRKTFLRRVARRQRSE